MLARNRIATLILLFFAALSTGMADEWTWLEDDVFFDNTPYARQFPPRLLAYTSSRYNHTNHTREEPPLRMRQKGEFQLDRILELEQLLKDRIHGQGRPIQTAVNALIRYASGLNDPESPIATLLFIGPTGVGKTELAKQLAQEITGSKTHLIRFDMSEYMEPHTVSKLIGTPPGYVGYDRGGQLTQAVKQKPNSIILLDEIEKAHPNVLQVFLQAFDDARITDAYGESIDCKRCLFILTTNLGAHAILTMQKEGVGYEEILKRIQPVLMQHLSPELFNRVEPVLFTPLNMECFNKIVHSQLAQVSARLYARKGIRLQFDGTLIEHLMQKGYSFELGARPLKRLIDKEIVTALGYALFKEQYAQDERLLVIYENDQVQLRRVAS